MFKIPRTVRLRALMDTDRGVYVRMTPEELVQRMRAADKALNGDSNDAEHDALVAMREWLSAVFEDPVRRTPGRKRRL